ncbi:MAG: adenosine-specific kinase [Candidatus Bathyarchaeia archaeon]
MELITIRIENPEGCNVILGMTHFIKSVEDLYEALVTSVPGIKFGLAFCEASGPCLVRYDGTDAELIETAKKNALALSCGHIFIIHLRDAYPINVLNRIKQVQEVCNIFAATANPLEVIVAETEQGRGILGVVDGFKSKGVETEADIAHRKEFLQRIGYKR